MRKYIINIKTGIIHDARKPCPACKKMMESNKKYFDTFESAENFFEGEKKKGLPCGKCFIDENA